MDAALVAPAPDGLLDALRSAVGDAHVLVDPSLVEPYVTDWTRRWRGAATAVVRPGTTDEVVAVVRACVAAGVPVHTQGGNTGLVGGAIPAPADHHSPAPVVLSTRRLTRLDEVDDAMGQVTCGAGVLVGDLRRHAEAAGWEYGVDFAARDSATIGGTIGTNAGGIRVVAYGMTRAQVVGVEAVLPDGSVVSHLAGLAKDNTGYDLPGLFVGSEGTLGVVTAARLKLHRPTPPSSVVLVGINSFEEGLALVRSSLQPGSTLLAAEIMDVTSLDAAVSYTGQPWPLEQRWDWVLLLETTDVGDDPGIDLPDGVDAVAALDAAERTKLWRYRECQGEAYSALGLAHHLDVSIPASQLGAAAAEIRARLEAQPGVTHSGIFGHLADGNLHVCIVGPDHDDESADLLVLTAVADHGGSISAEHGVGRAKALHLSLCRSESEIAAMRALKAGWDPQGLFAPGVIFG
jgi:FAD/FMN-containing dehydrogenase